MGGRGIPSQMNHFFSSAGDLLPGSNWVKLQNGSRLLGSGLDVPRGLVRFL